MRQSNNSFDPERAHYLWTNCQFDLQSVYLCAENDSPALHLNGTSTLSAGAGGVVAVIVKVLGGG